MFSNPSHIQRSIPSLNQSHTLEIPTPLERDPRLGRGLEQVHEDNHYVIHDMAITETSADVVILAGDGIDVSKMTQDLEDILSSFSDSRLGQDPSKTPRELTKMASIPDQSSRDIGPVVSLSYDVEQAFLDGAIDGRPWEMPVVIEGKTAKLHEDHPWSPAKLVSNSAEDPWMNEPERRQAIGAHDLDKTVSVNEDMWSIKTLLGDLDEDMEWELFGAAKTVQTDLVPN